MDQYLTDERTRERMREANRRWRERHVEGHKTQNRTVLVEPTEADKAWCAGFLDGEGYVGALRDGKGYVATRIAVSQVVVDPLIYLQERWGGVLGSHATRQKNRRDSFNWVLSNKEMVAGLIRDVRPYLRVKGAQADALLELALLPKLVRGQPNIELHEKRDTLYEQLRRLNRRGREEVV